MPTFPTFASGSMYVGTAQAANSLMKHPASFEYAWKTRSVRFLDDSEQAWTVHPPLFGVTLQFAMMNGYDTSIIRDFFYLMKGKYVDPNLVNVFDMTIRGVNYPNLVFDQDVFETTVGREELFTFSLRVRQVVSSYVGA